jgi:hypothetical protein
LPSIQDRTYDLAHRLQRTTDNYDIFAFRWPCEDTWLLASFIETIGFDLHDLLKFSGAVTLDILKDVLTTWEAALPEWTDELNRVFVLGWTNEEPEEDVNRAMARIVSESARVKSLHNGLRACRHCIHQLMYCTDR